MKSFLQFLTETTASQQAARLGLQGDGHGGWYDRKTGEFTAKTEKGKLKFYNKRQVVGGKDPKQSEQEKNYSSPNTQVPPESQQAPAPEQQAQPSPEEIAAQEQQAAADQEANIQSQIQSPDLQAGPPPVPKTRGTLTLAFGRFNPPHAGHGQLMDIAAESAAETEGDYIIVPSRSNDPKKNPLDADFKVSTMRNMFPDHAEKIVNDPINNTIFDVLKKAHNDGYTNVRIVAGDDRVKQFDKLSQNYNGQLYQFDGLETISSGAREDDSEGMEGYSASRMRLAAIEGDFKSFYQNLQQQVPAVDEQGQPIYEVDPNTGEQLIDEQGQPIQSIDLVPLLNRKAAKDYFIAVRQAMGAEEVQECWNIWEIAPKEDPENLREAYISKEIFDIGTKVEDVNTGLIGRILRRGANHLICVTEGQIMFKSWIKDVTEAVVNGTTISGVPATQRLVGTDAHLRYVATMVPGSNWGIDFINKYKVRKN
tara:strand:- start:930 stop:2369 length:1440 start_codon:yes stop_codon:yes gene_type:complete